MPDFFEPSFVAGAADTAAVHPRNGRVTEYYLEKVWLWTPPPPPTPPKLRVVGDSEIYIEENPTPRVEGSYDDIYGEKVWHKHNVDYQTYWMGVDWCKEDAEPHVREPYDAPRKGRRGWNQPKPHYHMAARRPRMNYRRRRRHG